MIASSFLACNSPGQGPRENVSVILPVDLESGEPADLAYVVETKWSNGSFDAEAILELGIWSNGLVVWRVSEPSGRESYRSARIDPMVVERARVELEQAVARLPCDERSRSIPDSSRPVLSIRDGSARLFVSYSSPAPREAPEQIIEWFPDLRSIVQLWTESLARMRALVPDSGEPVVVANAVRFAEFPAR